MPRSLEQQSPCHILAIALLLLFGLTPSTKAHPVPKKSHDRTAVVRLTPDAVIVEYRLEVDEWTAVNDLVAVISKEELAKLSTSRQCYEAYTRSYAPLLADNLIATLDRKLLEFTCTGHGHEVKDHLRCNFVFKVPWKPEPGQHEFSFKDNNFELDPGRINLSIAIDTTIDLVKKREPDEALKNKMAVDLRPGDDARLRELSATFRCSEAVAHPAGKSEPADQTKQAVEQESEPASTSMLNLLLNTKQGFWMLMLLAAGFGAAHALTPGHGKTLVAAYLVGERGTVWHALLLGLVTTMTHTGVVLMVAAVLPLVLPNSEPGDVQFLLSLGSGLLVTGLGFWLLIRRLTNRADHFHFGHSHHHDHDHVHGDHDHGHAHPLPAPPVGLWGLVVLGATGGMVPCGEAIWFLGFAIKAQRLALAFPLLVAFSAGLAGVLVVIGITMVYARGSAASRWGESRLFRSLPVLSALVITCIGLWLCYDSVHPSSTPAAARQARP